MPRRHRSCAERRDDGLDGVPHLYILLTRLSSVVWQVLLLDHTLSALSRSACKVRKSIASRGPKVFVNEPTKTVATFHRNCYLATEVVAALAAPFAASVMRSATVCGSCSMATWQVGTEMATPRAFFAPASSIAGLNV